VRSCQSCGASSPAESSWCGQCFTSLTGVPATAVALAPRPATASVPAPAVQLQAGPQPARVMSDGHAVGLTVLAIGIGAVGMGVAWLLGQDESLEPATYLRYAIVLTLGVYAVVGALLVTRIAPGVRLRWQAGHPAGAILFGALVGGGLGAMMLAAVSSASGHLAPDPRMVTMMSEGDLAHLAAAVLIGCICAPLVEEVLFRGVLLESLRTRGKRTAIWGSAVAFSVWHLNPSALRYYALMGALLGFLYLRRGLLCSIAAHVGFNGVLTVAAMAVVLAPSHVISAGGVSVSAPGGWHVASENLPGLVLEGPSGAMFAAIEVPGESGPSVQEIGDRLRAGMLDTGFPGLEVHSERIRNVHLPVGDAVEIDVTSEGHRGTLVFAELPAGALEIVFMSGGSMKAQSDFERMLPTLRVA
jgi:membrane protease YdiL (CAAX protease family)